MWSLSIEKIYSIQNIHFYSFYLKTVKNSWKMNLNTNLNNIRQLVLNPKYMFCRTDEKKQTNKKYKNQGDQMAW